MGVTGGSLGLLRVLSLSWAPLRGLVGPEPPLSSQLRAKPQQETPKGLKPPPSLFLMRAPYSGVGGRAARGWGRCLGTLHPV